MLVCISVCWCVLVCVSVCWCVLVCVSVCWCVLVCVGMLFAVFGRQVCSIHKCSVLYSITYATMAVMHQINDSIGWVLCASLF